LAGVLAATDQNCSDLNKSPSLDRASPEQRGGGAPLFPFAFDTAIRGPDDRTDMSQQIHRRRL